MSMNFGTFVGLVANEPTFRDGNSPVCYITLIRDEYAGRDQDERKVAIPFTVFGQRAAAIRDNVMKGDQLIVRYRLANNDRETEAGKQYGFSFIVDDFEFAAPGKAKRAKMANERG